MPDPDDHALGFVAAAHVPAVATGLAFMTGVDGSVHNGFGSALGAGALAFVAALVIAGVHVGFVAVPLYALFSRRGPPGPGLVLAAATLIGALPMSLLFYGNAKSVMIFGLAGLVGGVAFLAVGRPGRNRESE
jgi:hypothetical protein